MDLPVIQFIQERLAESDAQLETRKGSGFYDLFVKPQELILQPFITAMETVLIGQSARRVLALTDPDSFDESSVDDLAANVYVDRDPGAYVRTTVRVYYAAPVDRQLPAFSAQFSASGSRYYFNELDFSITKSQMALQVSGNLYYFDVAVRSQTADSSFDLSIGDITTYINDTEAVSATNLSAATGGLPKETNTELLTRARNSIGVRDLETVKGINSILLEKFPTLREIQAIGMGDQEMMRDILYNAHIGGKTDIYVKTPALQELSTTISGVTFDTTREVKRNIHRQMITLDSNGNEIPITSFSSADSELNTPFIVVGSVSVKDDVVETSASFTTTEIPPVTGVNLTGAEWIKLKVDSDVAKNIKVSGANPAATQRFEIINSINSAVGKTIAEAFGINLIRITSPTKGASSLLELTIPDSPKTDATPIVVPSTFSMSGTFVTGSFTVTVVSTIKLAPGMGLLTNAYIPAGTYVGEILSSTQFNMTNTALSPGGTISFTVNANGYSPATYVGVIATPYTETFDYEIDYDNGKIRTLPSTTTIKSGKSLIGSAATPHTLGETTASSNFFKIPNAPPTPNFSDVRPGDLLYITASTDITIIGVHVVSTKLNNYALTIQGLNPSTTDSGVNFYIVSQQVLAIDFKYNPLSVDIGPKVLLSDGVSRGIRPGRDNYTIKDVAFVDVVSIEEVDPDTLEGLNVFLTAPMGYGGGGYGEGGYGGSLGGDYEFVVNDPNSRYSAFEDSMILFEPSLFGKSYKITYKAATEIASIHSTCRDDLERVTGADVLPKFFIPGFVDISIGIRRDPTNISTPSDAALTTLVEASIDSVKSGTAIRESEIVRLLEDQGLASVKTPILLHAEVLNPDGSSTIYESEDTLIPDEVTLAKETTNFTTKRIVHWVHRNVTLTEVA